MKKMLLTLTTLCLLNDANAMRPIPDSEVTSDLVEGREITSLMEVEQLGLNEGETGLDLWSGSYWPHYRGALAIRYRDPQFRRLIEANEQFGKYKDLSEKRPIRLYTPSNFDLLSPAEKYDLIVGDTQMSLTKYSWSVGEKASSLGKVPLWRGICDGWASASQMMPRPVRSVVMNTPNGTPVTFFPEDIKALGSLLYARAQDEVIFLGKRCRSRFTGMFSGACDETNPGTFHRALVNRVGKMKKSFIADVSPGTEVWNYPVQSYDITYFNVLTDAESKNFRQVMEPFIKKNRFSRPRKRHDRTAAIVGVKLVVRYADMREANLLDSDSTLMDKVLEKEYYYDLELDSRFNVLGGESISANLPDFIWAPDSGTYPLSDPERELGFIPTLRSEIVRMSRLASKDGQPLSFIIEELFESAK